MSLGAQGSALTAGTGETASSVATAAGAAAHSCCSSSICSGAMAPLATGNPAGPDAVVAPLCSSSGAVPAAAQCCSACCGSRPRPKSAGGCAGAPAAAAVLDRPELPLPRPAVEQGTWSGSCLHSSSADQSGADRIMCDQQLRTAPEPAGRPPAAAPAASELPMGTAPLLLRFGAAMLSPDSRRLFCPAVDLLHSQQGQGMASAGSSANKGAQLHGHPECAMTMNEVVWYDTAPTVGTLPRPPEATAPVGSAAQS